MTPSNTLLLGVAAIPPETAGPVDVSGACLLGGLLVVFFVLLWCFARMPR